MLQLALCFLLTIVCVPHIDALNTNGSTPQLPRFCNLAVNATNFTCDYVSYTKNVATRSFIGLIVAAIALVILTFTEIGICFHRCFTKKRSTSGRFNSKLSRLFVMSIPLLLFVLGSLIIVYAHFQFEPVFTYSTSVLKRGSNDILKLRDDINSNVSKIHELYPDAPSSLPLSVSNRINEVSDNLLKAYSSSADIRNGRIILIAVSVSIACLAGIIGLGLCQTNHGFCFFSVIALSVILIVGSCIAIGSLAVIEPILKDTCKEVDYKGSIFDLIESQSIGYFSDFQNTLNSEVNKTMSDICSVFKDYCQKNNELCGVCNEATFSSFTNSTITDQGGSKKTLKECNSTCTSTDLKKLSSNYFTVDYLKILSSNIILEVVETISNFFGPKDELRLYLCGSKIPSSLIYVACGLFLSGCAFSAFFMFLITKSRPVDVVGEYENVYQLS